MERGFNLIDEPWIAVTAPDCTVKELSLSRLFQDAHNYTGLAGEMKTQDLAVLRMLLAIVHTVLSRYDAEGNDLPPGNTRKKARAYWERIWAMKRFPYKPFERYFREWHGRFRLFDEEFPFYQVVSSANRTSVRSAKLIGSFSQSGNKPRLFAERSSQGLELSYPEAARWLINLNSFDDTAAKNPTPKKAWTSTLGLIAAVGDNLFETLMLNYIPEAKPELPAWERDIFISEPNRAIAFPDNQAELLTLQSRRLLLQTESGSVTGCLIAGGDYFDYGELSENMTVWKPGDRKKSEPDFVPARHRSGQSAWREFGAIAGMAMAGKENEAGNELHIPGVIEWIGDLNEDGVLDNDYVVDLITASVGYDFKQATSLPINDAFSDTLSFHASLLRELGRAWRGRIYEEIQKCEKAADSVWMLSKHLQEADGASGDKISGNEAKRRYFERIDRPFRQWLRTLTPECDQDEYRIKLEKQLKSISIKFGEELASECSDGAVLGHYKKPGGKDNENSRSKAYSAVKELNLFSGIICGIFKAGGENNVG